MENQTSLFPHRRPKHLIAISGTLLSIFLLVLIVFFAVGISNKIKEGKYIGQEIEARNTITVSDSADVYAKPDLAITSFSVTNEAKTVAEAMSANTEKMNEIINYLKEEGMEGKDLKTTNFNIYPRYEYSKATYLPPYYNEGKRILAGYEVTQSLQIKIRNMEKIGQLIEGATSKGANIIGDLQFTIDNQDELKKQVRAAAIAKAKTKAEELANQLDVKLVRIVNFYESGISPYYDMTKSAMPMAEGMGGGETAQIEVGENKVEVSVSITYEIR